MSQHLMGPPRVLRRELLGGAVALGAAAGTGAALRPRPALAQDAAKTLGYRQPGDAAGA